MRYIYTNQQQITNKRVWLIAERILEYQVLGYYFQLIKTTTPRTTTKYDYVLIDVLNFYTWCLIFIGAYDRYPPLQQPQTINTSYYNSLQQQFYTCFHSLLPIIGVTNNCQLIDASLIKLPMFPTLHEFPHFFFQCFL